MTKKYHVVVEKDEDGWFVSEVLELPGCHTQAKTREELLKRTKEAIKAYLHNPAEEKTTISSEFLGVQEIEV
ncbi:MAG: type II toxin-antitoxin system HicB family antitoxin [Candidatus Woesearchaeota archaeon]|nr:type II toxin-antitoxin system HicB family antitoxin [Candidatus Woesearchaeota archaeon]